MKCIQCGKKFKGRYCPRCGYDHGEAAEESKTGFLMNRLKDGSDTKWYQSKKAKIIIAVIAALLIISFATSGDSSSDTKKNVANDETEVTETTESTVEEPEVDHGSVVSLKASYSGSREAGTYINDYSSITVYATFEDGTEEDVDDWEVSNPQKLKAGQTATITITYEGAETTLKIKCTTLTKAQYKEKCKTVKYKTLLRNPDKYKGKYVKFKGKVNQVIQSGQIKMAVTRGRYGIYDDDILVIYDEKTKILKDDIVTIYGQSAGNYTYETVLGANKEVPLIYAKYYSIK